MSTTIRNNRAPQILRAIGLAANRSLVRAGQAGRTYLTRAIAEDIGTTQKRVRPRIIPEQPEPNMIQLRATKKRLRQIDLPARRRARIPGAFRVRLRSGHEGIFRRAAVTRSRKGKGLPRSSPQLPIVEQLAVSVPYVAINKNLLEPALAVMEAAFEKNLAHEVGRALGGAS